MSFLFEITLLSKYLSIDNKRYKSIIINTVTTDPGHNFEPDEFAAYGLKLTDELGVTAEDKLYYNNTNYILLGIIIQLKIILTLTFSMFGAPVL